jgi:WD40 repeat protein
MTLIYDSFNSSVAEFKQLWDSGDRSNALRIFDRIRSLPGFCWSKEAILIRNLLQKTAKKGELRSWSFIRSFHGHSDTVGTLKAGQDGLTLLTGSLDGAAALWDVVSGRCLTRFHVDSPVGTALLLPRTNRVITWSHDNTVRIWDAEGGLVSEIPGVALPIALASGGHELSAVTPEHEPVRISLDTGKRLFRGVPIRCDEFLCFSAGLESIYTLRDGTRIQRWSATTGRNESSFRDLGIKITALVPTAANDRVVVGMENGEVVVYLVGSGINVATLRGHTAAVRAIACGREARYWITGSDDCSLRLWNLQEERCAAVLQGHASPIRAVCVFPNISLVASSGLDVSARLWGLEWDFSVFG